GQFDDDRLAPIERGARQRNELLVEMRLEFMVLPDTGAPRCLRRGAAPGEHRREVEAFGLPVPDRAVDVKELGVPDRVLEAPKAELREQLPDLLGEILEEGHDELGPAGEPCSQLRILCRYADG